MQGMDKRLINNWRPISLFHTDQKKFSKNLLAKLKSVLLPVTALQQTTYIQNRNSGEGGRLISDILDISDKLSIDDWLDNVNIEKAFDSPDHGF